VYAEDAYTVEATVSVSGGGFEKVNPVEVSSQITDTINPTKVTIEDISAREGGTATFVVKLDHAVAEGDSLRINVILDNNDAASRWVDFAAGESEKELTIPVAALARIRSDNFYVDGETTHAATLKVLSGGTKFEALDVTDTATLAMIDDKDTSTVKLSSSLTGGTDAEGNLIEGGKITYTAIIKGAPPKCDLTVALGKLNDQGEYEPLLDGDNHPVTITIAANQSSGSVTFDTRADDAFIQGVEETTVRIEGVTSDGEHGLEDLTFSDASQSVKVVDDVDSTTATIASDFSAATAEQQYTTYTVTLDNVPADGTTKAFVEFRDDSGNVIAQREVPINNYPASAA
jgi:hypothetical protein